MSNGFNPLKSLMQGFRAGEEIRQAPQRQRLADLALQQQQLGLTRQQQVIRQDQAQAQREGAQFDQGQAIQRAKILNQSARAMKQIPLANRRQVFEQLLPRFEQFGIDLGDQQPDLSDAGLDGYIAETQGIISDPSLLTASMREFQSLTKGLTPEEQEKARRVKLGLDPRAGLSAQERIAQDPRLAEMVGVSQAGIEGAKEAAKLGEQLKLKPEIEAAVKKAVSDVTVMAELAEESRSDSKALNLYEVGMGGLSEALGQTSTGPVMGMLPAVTAEAQIAEGAISAMAPILKQMFRAAGEGTFTDTDQAMLMRMLPTRSDRPKARVSKLQNIDAIVRAKLSKAQQSQPQQQKQGGQVMIDANGNRAIVYPDGTFEEL